MALTRQKLFLNSVQNLGLEHPNKEIVAKTGFTKGHVSKNLNPNGVASRNFIETVAEKFGFDATVILKARNPKDKSDQPETPAHTSSEPDVHYGTEHAKYVALLEQHAEMSKALLETSRAAIRVSELAFTNYEKVNSMLEADRTMIDALTEVVVSRFANLENVKPDVIQAVLHNTVVRVAADNKRGRSALVGR